MKKEELIKDLNPLFFKGFAHRGLHTKEFTENGKTAFQNAHDHNRAIELDVHRTKDNQLIVVQDSDLKRVTGKEGIVENRSNLTTYNYATCSLIRYTFNIMTNMPN